MELSEGEKIIQEAIRRKKEDEKRERKCNQELKKWDEVYKEIVSRYENVKESQETLTFQEYCLKQWMRKNGVELKICKITDAKVQNYLDEQAKNNAKNNKAEDPEYNLDVREKREKIGKEIKKKLKIIIGNEYKKLVTMIADKTLLTASNMVFFDLLLPQREWNLCSRSGSGTDRKTDLPDVFDWKGWASKSGSRIIQARQIGCKRPCFVGRFQGEPGVT